MNKKPHSLKIGLSYQVGNNPVKTIGKPSEVEGWYVFPSEGKADIRIPARIPMRSFVANFLNKLHGIVTASSGEITKLTTASFTVAQQASNSCSKWLDKRGILVGEGLANVTPSDAALGDIRARVDLGHGAVAFTAPYVKTTEPAGFACNIRRNFTNASSTFTIYEVGLQARQIHPRATVFASNAASALYNKLYARDRVEEVFDVDTNKYIDLQFDLSRDDAYGGATINLMKMLYNFFLYGSANGSAFIPRQGAVLNINWHASYSASWVSNPLKVSGAAGKYYGILVSTTSPIQSYEGDEYAGGVIPPSANNMKENTTLTYGANTVSAVVTSGSRTFFTVSRDITNGTASSVNVTGIGLCTRGLTVDGSHTAIQTDQVYLALNTPTEPISLSPNQTLRVTYSFEITA